MKYLKNKIEDIARNPLRSYERATYEEIAPVTNARKDFEGYSTILINRVDRKGKYLEILLEDTNKFQRLANGVEYMVLLDRVGNTKDYYATGRMVRKDVVFGRGKVKTCKDSISEGL